MAKEDIRLATLMVQGQNVELYETVDVIEKVDDGDGGITVIGDRLGYVVRGRGAGQIKITDAEGVNLLVEPSSGPEKKTFTFETKRTGFIGYTTSYPV